MQQSLIEVTTVYAHVMYVKSLCYRESVWSANFWFGADYSSDIKRVTMTLKCCLLCVLNIASHAVQL